VAVGHELFRNHPRERLEVLLRPGERLDGGQVVHVPDVLAEPRIPSGRDRAGVLEVTADGEGGTDLERQRHRQRGKPAGAAHRQLDAADDAGDRVVAGHVDPTVVGQPDVDERCKPHHRLIVIGDDRLPRGVARGHHEDVGAWGVCVDPEEQGVDRRVGQHHPKVRVARSDGGGELPGDRLGPDGQQDNGAPDAGQQRPLRVADLDKAPRDLEVGDHDGERLVPTSLSASEQRNRLGVARVAHQVVAAEPLDR